MLKNPNMTSEQFQFDNRFYQRLFACKFTLSQAFLQNSANQNQIIFPQSFPIKTQIQPQKYIKGLKQLSKKVKEVTFRDGPLSYRDVANKLIIDSQSYLVLLQSTERQKQEQNIKRRVYDALNVLIASGILIKKGKKVSGNQQGLSAQKSSLSHQIELTRKKAELKNQQLIELTKFINKLESHFNENKNKKEQMEKIYLPISAVIVGKKYKIIKIKNDKIIIKSNESIINLDEVQIFKRLIN